MSAHPLRFIHTSDWRLEQPLIGLGEVPEPLRGSLIEAPYLAAERVVEAALDENVDFVAVSGNVLDVELGGPRAIAFVVEQFNRLAARDIAVYWCGGDVDPISSWFAPVWLPENVHRFTSPRMEELIHRRDGVPIARLLGHGWPPGDLVETDSIEAGQVELPTIVVAHGERPMAWGAPGSVDYWALGGSDRPHIVHDLTPAAAYPGSPQARRPHDVGEHGCTLVRLDATRRATTTFVPTDLIRFAHEHVDLTAVITRGELESILRRRVESIASAAKGVDVLVHWTIAGGGPLESQLRHGRLAAELLDQLQSWREATRTSVWSIDLAVEPPPGWSSTWQQEETLLGDFLREVQRHFSDDADPLELNPADARAAAEYGFTWPEGDASERNRLRDQVAALGIDLLRPEEPRS